MCGCIPVSYTHLQVLTGLNLPMVLSVLLADRHVVTAAGLLEIGEKSGRKEMCIRDRDCGHQSSVSAYAGDEDGASIPGFKDLYLGRGLS